MEFGLLGPVALWKDGVEVPITAAKRRGVLAILLLHANEPVSVERIIDELWDERPPATAKKAAQQYVLQLRKAIGGSAIEWSPAGYVLHVDADALDRDRFERLLAEGRALLERAEPARAAEVLRSALALWRGPALADFQYEAFARNEIERLEELRLATVELRLEAELELGRASVDVPELEVHVRQHPLRERLRALLIMALYRAGRQVDALAAYQDARATLIEELGLEPGDALQRLEKAILVHDPALGVPERRQQTLAPAPLPVPPTSLIGRERESDAVARLVDATGIRLVTLVGPGGTGKTRLALRVAERVSKAFPDGVAFVALAPLAQPELVISAVGQALGIRDSSLDATESLARFLAARRMLVVLDNFEHLLEAAPAVGAFLAACPSVTCLVTSRVALRLSAEHEFSVPPLETPDPRTAPDLLTLADCEAVALFVERARAARHGFELTDANAAAVSELCARLDGLPLAIELAAARTKLLPPQAMLERLDDALELLSGGPRDAPMRQRTLRAAIAWSFDLLTAREQTLFARLAVFAGGCTLSAAEAICDGDDLLTPLAALVDSSLLRLDEQPDGTPRYSMLETIRAFALEQLDARGETEEMRRRHAEHYVSIGRQIDTDRQAARDIDLLAVERDHDNFRAALLELAARDDRESLVSLVRGLCVFWGNRGDFEAVGWAEKAVQLADGLPPSVQARAAYDVAMFAIRVRQLTRASSYAELALRLSREAGDPRGEASALRELGIIAGMHGELDRADALSGRSEAMFRAIGDPVGVLTVVHDQAIWAIERRDLVRARALLEESLAASRALGSEPRAAVSVIELGALALMEQRENEAVSLLVQSLESAVRGGLRPTASRALRGLAVVMANRGDAEVAARLLGAAEAVDMQIGDSLLPYELVVYWEPVQWVVERSHEPAIAAAWAVGRRMSEDDVVDYVITAVVAPVTERVSAGSVGGR
jgi:predicted ATPase/DNA-binding SARP family transcriptional activator